MAKIELHTSFIKDFNPVWDTGYLTSTGGLIDTAKLANAIGIEFSLSSSQNAYTNGWGNDCANSRTIVGTLFLTIPDLSGNSTTISLDIVEGTSPLIIVLDISTTRMQIVRITRV